MGIPILREKTVVVNNTNTFFSVVMFLALGILMTMVTGSLKQMLIWITLIAVAFKLYDLRQTGYIEREEVSFDHSVVTWCGILDCHYAIFVKWSIWMHEYGTYVSSPRSKISLLWKLTSYSSYCLIGILTCFVSLMLCYACILSSLLLFCLSLESRFFKILICFV